MCRRGTGDGFAVISLETREGKSQGAGPHPRMPLKGNLGLSASPGDRLEGHPVT